MILRAVCLLLGISVAPIALAQPLDNEERRTMRFELDGARGSIPALQLAAAKGSRSYLGIAVIEIDDERAKDLRLSRPKGVEITNVVLNGPADKAGIEDGDVLLEYSGEAVRGVAHLARMVRETPAGREVEIELWREGKAKRVMARIGERNVNPLDRTAQCGPDEECGEFRISRGGDREIARIRVPLPRIVMRSRALGAETEEVEGQFAEFFGAKHAVLVRSVEKDSAAESAGLRAGDVILSVNEQTVQTPMDLIHAVRRAGDLREVPLKILRQKRAMTLTLSLEDGRSLLGPARLRGQGAITRN